MRSPSTFLITGLLARTSSNAWPVGSRPVWNSRRLHEAGCGGVRLFVTQVPEILHFEEAPRVRAGDPGWVTAPGAGARQRLELGVDPFEMLLGEPLQSVVHNSPHGRD